MAGEQENTEPVAPVETPPAESFGQDDKMDTEAVADDLARALGALDDEKEPDEVPPAEAAPPTEEKPPQVPEAEKPPVQGETEWTPNTWRAAAKAKWATLDPDIKAEVQKREADVAKFVNEAQPALGVQKALGEVLTPYAGIFKQYNIAPIQHIANLLQAHTQLVFGTPEQKLEMFKHMATEAGFNLAALSDPNAAPVDPNRSYIRNLEQKVLNLENVTTGVAGSLREAREAELAQKIEVAATDKEKFPYFWDVAPEMTQLINGRVATNLEDAYQMAVLQNPVYRAKIVETDVEKQLAARQAADRERVAAARKASGASIRSRSGGKSSPPPESIDETLRSKLAEINSRTQH